MPFGVFIHGREIGKYQHITLPFQTVKTDKHLEIVTSKGHGGAD